MQIFSDYEIGAKLNYHYLNSRPFPHIVLDNFINSNTATQCFNELKTTDHWATESSNNAYMRDHQVNKLNLNIANLLNKVKNPQIMIL